MYALVFPALSANMIHQHGSTRQYNQKSRHASAHLNFKLVWHSGCFRTLSSSGPATHKLGCQSNLFLHQMTLTTLLLRLVVCFSEVLQPIQAGHSLSRDSLVASLCGAQDDEASPAKRRRVDSF